MQRRCHHHWAAGGKVKGKVVSPSTTLRGRGPRSRGSWAAAAARFAVGRCGARAGIARPKLNVPRSFDDEQHAHLAIPAARLAIRFLTRDNVVAVNQRRKARAGMADLTGLRCAKRR